MKKSNIVALGKLTDKRALAASNGTLPLCFDLYEKAEMVRKGELAITQDEKGRELEKPVKYSFSDYVKEFTSHIDRRPATLQAATGCFVDHNGKKYEFMPELTGWTVTSARRLYYAAQCGEKGETAEKRAAAVAYIAAHELTAANASKHFDELDAARKAAKKAEKDAAQKAEKAAAQKAEKDAQAAQKAEKDAAQAEKTAAQVDADRIIAELMRLAQAEKAADADTLTLLKRGLDTAILGQVYPDKKYRPLGDIDKYFKKRARLAADARELAQKAQEAREKLAQAEKDAADRKRAADAAEIARIDLARAARDTDERKATDADKAAYEKAAQEAADAAKLAQAAQEELQKAEKDAKKAEDVAQKAADKAA